MLLVDGNVLRVHATLGAKSTSRHRHKPLIVLHALLGAASKLLLLFLLGDFGSLVADFAGVSECTVLLTLHIMVVSMERRRWMDGYHLGGKCVCG